MTGLFDNLPGASLAPMAGVTGLPFRILAREMGAALCVTEMVSAKGLCYAGRDIPAVKALLDHEGETGTLGLQLFGHEEEYLVRAAKMLENEGFAFIDINMGCPAKKIVGNGEGSALMKQPLLVGKLVSALVKATRLPVTVKMRSGWDEAHINAPEIAKICEDAGASAVTVHARTREMQYGGCADREVISKVVSSVKIPVIGNGDIKCGEDALSMKRETGCRHVMVGRAAMGNPWIFREILCAEKGEPFAPPDITERVHTALRHMELLSAQKGEHTAIPEMRAHVAWYIKGEKGASRLRDEINHLTSAQQMRDALEGYLQSL